MDSGLRHHQPEALFDFSGIDPKVPSTEPPVAIKQPGGSPPPRLADGDVSAVNLLPGTQNQE